MKIKLNGNEYTYSFGLGYLGELLENLDLSVFEIGKKLDKNPFKWIPELLYENLKYYNDIDFSKGDLLEWLDNDKEANKKMSDFVQSSQCRASE